MADGNVGSLFMTLGLKDEVTVGLNKVTKSLSKSKQYTDELKKEVEGLRKELKGVSGTDMSEPIKKALDFIKKYDSKVYESINETNRLAYALRGVFENSKGEIKINLASIPKAINELAKLSKTLDSYGDNKEGAKAFKNSVANAIDYLKMLQSIERKQRELNDLAISSRNIDKADIASAKMMLNDLRQSFAKQLFNKESGSLIDTNFMSEVKKILSMTMTEIGDYMRNLKKDNPLSVFVNSADMLTSKISSANKKILEMQSLMRGSKLPNLFDDTALRGLRGIVGEMQKLIQKEGKGEKTDINKINRLVSEYAKLVSQAELAKSTFKQLSREYDNANARLVSWFSKYRELQSIRNDRVRLGLDTSAIDAEISRVRALFSEINSIRNGLKAGDTNFLGMLGSRGTGVDTNIFQRVVKDAKELIAVQERIRRKSNADREREDRKADRQRATDMKNAKNRMRSLYDIYREMRSEIARGMTVGADTKRAEEKLNLLIEKYRALNSWRNTYSYGSRLGDLGSSADIRGIVSALRALKEANRELTRSKGKTQEQIDAENIYRATSAYNKLLRVRAQVADSLSMGKGIISDSEYIKLQDYLTKLEQIRTVLERITSTKNGVDPVSGLTASEYLKSFEYTTNMTGAQIASRAALNQIRANAQDTGRQIQLQLVKGFKDANNAAGRLNSTVQDLKSLFMQGGLVFGAQQFAMSIIRTGGEMEKQHIAMQSILGDMQNANTMFNQTKELALRSPFTFSELNRDVKQLAAYGVEYENLYETTKRLADMASGLGVSFERIALAFGQVQARGWLDGKELRQIAYAGIPLLDRLSKYYSMREGKKVTTSDVKGRITNREVSFQDVKNIFWEMTDAGGQFYNMQLTLSETLLGRYNKLKDAWEIMLSDFARGDSIIGGTFKTILDSLTYIVQQMHTLGPVMAAAFTGFAIKRGLTSLGGGGAKSFLGNKANLADNAQAKLMQGQKLSQIEQQILLTKNRITNADLRSLIAYQNINKNELRRLYLSGAITKEQYKISLALMKQVGLTNAAAASTNKYALSWGKVGAAGMLALNGIGNAAKGLWAAIGGLPGLILTVLTMGVTTLVSRYQDLTQKIKQTQDEIFDRRKQVADFTSQNNVAKAIASGEQKEIDNLIESYKEKLKELAPYDYSNLIMRAEEKKSHEERLKFLEQELKLIDEANKANSLRFADNGKWYTDIFGITGDGRQKYSIITDSISNANDAALRYEKAFAKANAYGATESDRRKFESSMSDYMRYVGNLKEDITKVFGDISKDENLRRQAVQAMNGVFSAIGVSAENANHIRASVLQAFGIYDDGWLSGEVGKRMSDLIGERFPEIALKIKSDQSLNDGEKKKVQELMKDAKSELINQYPIFSTTLQNLLDKSNFKAVISLVTQSMGGGYNDIQNIMTSRVPSKLSKERLQQYAGKIDSWGKEGDWYSARNKAKSDIDLARNQAESAKLSKDERDKWKQQYEDLTEIALTLLNYDYKGELKKSNKESKGNKEDEELKRLRKRIELYKKFYSEYKKLQDLVGQGALDKLRKDGEFDPVFKYGLNNITDYESSVRQLLGAVPANTADRIDYKNQTIADIQTKNRELFSEQISKDNEELRTQLGIISEQYEVYKKMYKLTADSEGAMSIAFGGGMATKTYSEYLKGEMAKILPTHNKNTGLTYSLEEVLGMSQSQFDSAYGKNNSRLSVLFSQYQDELKKIKTETINMIGEVIEKNRTLEQQLQDINTEYEYQLGLLQAQKDLTPDMRKRAEEGLKKTRDVKTASVQFEIFKRNSDWVAIFDDLDRVSTNTINSMIDKIDTFSKTAGLSVEVVKQLRDALDKLRKESMDRNPFDALLNATARGNAIGSLIRQNRAILDNGGKVTISDAIAKKTGLRAGQSYGKSELENEQASAYEDFPEALKAIESKFKALGDVLSPVISLFEALGMEDTPLAQGMSLATNALGAASGVAGGLKALGLESAGPYGAAIGAGLSVIGGLFAMHDKALQKEIDASKRRQQEMENMSKNIQSVLETTLGGIYTYKATLESKARLNDIIKSFEKDEYLRNYGNYIEKLGITNRYSYDTYQQALKAQKSGTVYDTELASLMAQKDELVKQRQAEEDKKNTDADAIQNYNQQIEEMEQSIKSFTQDFLRDIYNIDLKSWASQLTDAIVEAWAKGENAADAYHDKVQELMKDLTKNILSQKIMEIALNPVLGELEKALQSKGRLDETEIPEITDMLIKAGDDAVGNITDLLDALKEQGIDLSENGTLSVSNSIKSITEDTADLLASYIQAIRLDVSVNRENLRLILVAVQSVPELNNIARSQLTQLTTLVSLAEARNSKLDDMYSWMNKVTNGVLKISMK